MKHLSHASTFLRRIPLSPFFVLRLSRGKRLVIVALSYGLGVSGLWLLFPFKHNGILLFLPFVCACWLFRYWGLLISFVLNVVAFHLFLSWGRLPDQPLVRMEIFGLLGISLALGLLLCWLQTRAKRVTRSLPLTRTSERGRALHSEGQVRSVDEQEHRINGGLEAPPIVLVDSAQWPKEQQVHLDLMLRTDGPTNMTPSDQQEVYFGQQIGEYRLVRQLGGGNFGIVYLAEQVQEHTLVAIKVLYMSKSEGLKDFLNEVSTMWLRHPHIVPLLDFGISSDDIPFLVMEYAPGGTLRDRYPRGEQVPLSTIVSYVDQVSSALQYAHDQRVIHRDVKPANILLRADGTLMLSDFGIAKLLEQDGVTSAQTQVGTPVYAAPEQYEGFPCFASDQYALAIAVYEWICGVRPFEGPTIGLVFQHMNTPAPRLRDRLPELPEAVEHVVLKGLAKDPADRFERIEEFAAALHKAVQSATPLDTSVEAVRNTGPLVSSEQVPRLARGPKSEPLVRVTQRVQISSKTQAKDPPQPPPAAALQDQNRMRLLQRVRSFWITGVLEQSLHAGVLLTLNFQEQPDAVANPWRLIVQESERAGTRLSTGTPITEVYEKAHGELLILGEPGSGKTTLLLSLARTLLEHAEHEQTHPIPVIFNLSSWMQKRAPLSTWLIEELETKYKVSRKIGTEWIDTNQILPLLDGLDEVDAPYRVACIQQINEYHQAHSLVPLVVCCRTTDYLSLSNRLALSRAVTIEPLTTKQVNEYFARSGESIVALRSVFQQDLVLQELATTPLMLSILIQAYQGLSREEIKGGVATERHPQQMFATYSERMLGRRSAKRRYEAEQTVHWLSLLAGQMKQESQSVFYVEQMQPSWLTKKWQRRLYYGLITGPIAGLFVGLQILGTVLPFLLTVLMTVLTIGLFFGWLSEPGGEKKGSKPITRIWMRLRQRLTTSLENRVKIGIAAGLVVGIGSTLYNYLDDAANWSLGSRIVGALSGGLPGGICMGVYVGLSVGLARRIEPLEGARWSWAGICRDNVRWLLIGISLIVGLMFALPFLIFSQDVRSANFLAYGLSTTFQLIAIAMLVSGVTRGLSKRVLDAQHIVTPNQGIWRSARSGIVIAIIAGGITGAVSAAIDLFSYFWLPLHMGSHIETLDMDSSAVSIMSYLLGFYPTTTQGFWMLHALFWGLVNGALPALAFGLYYGGAAYIQHFVLRILLWCARSAPFNYPRFLDYAAERILLRKVGGGYIFMHRLLLEYFASLGEKPDLSKSDV
jgi:serine/threonine protein kinase/DNA polymerase III delta prime subunit